MNMMSGEVFFASFHRVAVGFNNSYAEKIVMPKKHNRKKKSLKNQYIFENPC